MRDDEEGFRITDRRHRVPDDEAPEPAPSAAPAAPARDAAEAPAPDDPWLTADASGSSPLDLRAVFMMFGSSALMALGEAADPATGQHLVDLEQAQEAIDVLMLLRDKTEGNRTEDESAFLDDVLYDLQLRFVRVTEGDRA